MAQGDTWMVCSACRKPIRLGATYQACSVSTCNRPRTRVVFCSVPCWDSHVSILRHRDAWAVESRAPATREEADREHHHHEPRPSPRPRTTFTGDTDMSDNDNDNTNPTSQPAAEGGATSSEILVVVSKIKKYIKEKSGMNCSDAVAQKLSDHVRAVLDQAIRNAGGEGRKTVLDRDVPRPE